MEEANPVGLDQGDDIQKKGMDIWLVVPHTPQRRQLAVGP